MSNDPRELSKQLSTFKDQMGTKSPHISIVLVDDGSVDPIHVMVCGNWPLDREELRFQVNQWADVMPMLREKWAAYAAKYNADLIRRIALAIIEITAVNGECTDAALRGTYRFSDEQVRKFGADAVAKANEMAANGPFSIIAKRGANAA